MLIIKIKGGESIDRALKRYRKKRNKTKLLREIKSRREFTKKSVQIREEIKKAQYKERMLLEKEK